MVGHVAGIEDLLGEDIKHIAVNPQNKQELIGAISLALDEPILAAERAVRIRKNALALIEWDRVASAYAKILATSTQ